MHGREGEEGRKKLRNLHMRAVPPLLGAPRDSDGSLSSTASSSPSFFFKDGRKISVGDSALFKLLEDSPPSIGIICSVTVTEEKNLKLGVNWLCRPAEVKLGKGIVLEAAPNEIFYSFKKNEIPATSLFHPCKVAFLPKGSELPSGISSFVCRRVYDITNRCLWWLTDQNSNEWQEDIEQLLYKTQVEMHASTQPNGRSPKQISGSMSTSQLKPGPDGLQNAASLPYQGKGKKREHAEQSSDTVKSECSLKVEESDCGQSESFFKSEITKLLEEGLMIDIEGVDRLVHVMFVDINERKMDLSARIKLTNVIIGTEKSDCLSRFVQMGGLTMLDSWLQDVHKGKTGDTCGPKDNVKVAEEFLLVLLHALDKLPVNLNALQTCNIGKSVNHLRSHKNLEIQKKARSLVDTWKKHVEAEMNMHDAKSGSNKAVSWSARSRTPEVLHVNRNTGSSLEGAPKSPSFQLSASKTAPAKLLHGETTSKSVCQFQGSMKIASPQMSASINLKDGQPLIGGSPSLTTSRDEKSSSSSPSQNSSQSCSGDHVKNGGSAIKEDARSSAAASNKMPCLASHHKKSVNGFPVSVASARETGPSRTASFNKNLAPDKASQSGLLSEKAADVTSEVNSHKFTVKIPNRSCSPAQRAAGGSTDDSSAMNSRPSSPFLERPDQLDAVMEVNADASQANALLDVTVESCQGNSRDTLNAHDEGDGPVDPGTIEGHSDTDENTKNIHAVSRSTISSPRNTLKLGRVLDASMSSMNALIESCVSYAEANVLDPAGDDVGMHLLASVAAGEMLKSEVASPTGSPCDPSLVEPSCKANDPEMKPLPLDGHLQEDNLSKDVGSDCTQKQHFKGSALTYSKGDGKTSFLCSDEQSVYEEDIQLKSSGSSKIINKSAVDSSNAKMDIYSDEGRQSKKNASLKGPWLDGMPDARVKIDSLISPLNRVMDEITVIKSQLPADVGSISGRESRKTAEESYNCGLVEAKSTGKILSVDVNEKELKTYDGLRAPEDFEVDARNKNEKTEKPNHLMILEVQTTARPGSDIVEHVQSETISEKKVSGASSKPQTDVPLQDVDMSEKSGGCEVTTSKEANETEECNSSCIHSSVALSLDRETKLGFDLNEGFSNDDGNCGESMNFNATSHSAVSVSLISPLPIVTSSSSASLSAPIALTAAAAAAAKGPFIPSDDLLRAKMEIGWKGSAATSAFRPAEPRKLLEMPTNLAGTAHSPDISLGKQSRPLLDFDLNVADERIIEDASSQNIPLAADSPYSFRSKVEEARCEMIGCAPSRASVGLGLDLNHADESSTDGMLIRNGRKVDTGVHRDFDLNDEPVVDASEPSTSGQPQLSSSVLAYQPPLSGPLMNGAETGKFSTLFHAGSSYPAVPVPPILSNRGDQSFPIFGAGAPPRVVGLSAGGIQFSPEMCRGPMLSSSPGLPFTSGPFQYSVFPYGTNFPLSSATLLGSPTYIDPSSGGRLGFPPPQFLGPSGATTSHFSRPYMVSLSDGSGNSNIESSKKWSRQGLDLNTGPGGPESDLRDETSALGPKQLSVGGPQSNAEEQARIYQVGSGLLKRKEPEGGWDGYRQSSWHP